MKIKKISKKQLTALILDQGINSLEEALKSNENVIAFRNQLYEKYDTSFVPRKILFWQFYTTFKPWLEMKISENELDNPQSHWPYKIDNSVARLIEKYDPGLNYQKYLELQEKLYDTLFAIDKNKKFNDLCELMLSEFHNDFFFVSALNLYHEHPELFDVQASS
jgi:hypothetical protein